MFGHLGETTQVTLQCRHLVEIKTITGNVELVQLVRFLGVELTQPDSNSRFDMSVIFTTNYFFSGRRRPRRQ
jgi:hypothetical protein